METRGVDECWHSSFEFSQTFTDISLLNENRERKLVLSFMNELWKYFVPFQCFDNSFLRIFSVLISLPVYIMNDS